MYNKIILRTISDLSFAGEKCNNDLINSEKGILLKPSPKSEMRI